MRMYDIINKKRYGGELTDSELEFFIKGYTNGQIPDYQASALLMAVCLNGMTDRETASMTMLMAESGDMLELSSLGEITVDKHSTGGIGDKTTLVISPIVASLGCTVAKLSGRGLGHTGGTIDKLESIKGYRTDLSNEEFMSVASKCGICVSGAAKNLVPADKKLYALRDVTATVSSIPLIVSSIMSKKLAGGSKSIVLDVKTGSGAFMKTFSESEELAKRMVSIGKLSGRNVSAVITDMDRPLGRTVGNSLEVKEAVALLRGEETDKNLLDVCLTLSAEMVSVSKNIPFEESLLMGKNTIENGKAYEKFLEWISLQGGDVSLFENDSAFGTAKYVSEFLSEDDGYLEITDAAGIGISAMLLGAGRATKSDVIDPNAGITFLVSRGEKVQKGQTTAILQSDSVSEHAHAINRLRTSLCVSQNPLPEKPLIYKIIR